ncbi:hypothetical protein R2R70_02535 [Cobetia sp. SIMBA_158]|uniref:hypothetical protein n=1 Tax=Cobetia sp. SIMBA_158 TaxID=3081617 RepID=UPI0039816F89
MATAQSHPRKELKHASDKMVGMMRDLDLIVNILDTMQHRDFIPASRKSDIAKREHALLMERTRYAREVLEFWVMKGDVSRFPEVRMRLVMMLKIPDAKFLATVDELAHVYQRRYHELAQGAIAKEKEWKARDRNDLMSRFTKKQFPASALRMSA